jgi:ribosomal protein L37AE/L43A
MKLTLEQKRACRLERREQDARTARAQAETLEIVKSGVCPLCGSRLRRNLALTGWWQCSQYGAEGFRLYADRPACSWQGFTE